jgi:hypothetical protein
MEMTTKLFTAFDFAKAFRFPVVFFTSVGHPTGVEIALLPETDMPFDLGDILVDSEGNWNGEGNPTDWNGNTVTKITVHSHKEIWTEQNEEANA